MSRTRAAALGALLVALVAYSALAGRLWDAGLAWDVTFLAVVVIPATLLAIWLALPYAWSRGVLPVGLALAVLAVAFRAAELDVLFNLAKLFALTALGFWFLSWFETVAWTVLVAVLIPGIDALSVWRGPTDYVVTEQPGLFEEVSLAFRVPGDDATANLGPPDVLFFALFLAAAARFGLRVAPTWLAMTGLLGATLVVTATTDVAGLPALPAICVGFLLPNADLLVHRLRRRGRPPARIYGRTDDGFYDLDADVLERTPSRIVLLTRDRPPAKLTLEAVDAAFPADPPPTGAAVPSRLVLGPDQAIAAVAHVLPNGLVVAPQDEVSAYLAVVHPEQIAAEEDKLERLKRERR